MARDFWSGGTDGNTHGSTRNQGRRSLLREGIAGWTPILCKKIKENNLFEPKPKRALSRNNRTRALETRTRVRFPVASTYKNEPQEQKWWIWTPPMTKDPLGATRETGELKEKSRRSENSWAGKMGYREETRKHWNFDWWKEKLNLLECRRECNVVGCSHWATRNSTYCDDSQVAPKSRALGNGREASSAAIDR